MSALQPHLPALLVALPLLGAFILPVLSHFGGGVRIHGRAALITVALTALAAFSVAAHVLSSGLWTYVFGASVASGTVAPLESGGIPIRIVFSIDAAGALMICITALSSLAAVLFAMRSERTETLHDGFFPLFLLLIAGVYGMMATGDVFNFFVFLEITSIAGAALAAYHADGGLGTEAGLKYAAVSTLGALSFLLGVGLLLSQYNVLNMAALGRALSTSGMGWLDFVAMGLMLVPLAMKCGSVPMHLWTPDTYSSAPAPISAFLLVSSQASLYGLFRISFSVFGSAFNTLPVGHFLIALAVLSMFIGVTMAIPQKDVKRLISHHAVSQTGYMLLGAGVCVAVLGNPAGVVAYGRDALAGSLFHMLNYAMYNGLLFLAAGAVIYRTGTRNLNEMGGLGRSMPWTMGCFMIGALAIAGIPPLSGFSSKWMLYESVFRFNPLLSIIAMVVSLLTLASFVKVFYAMFLGPTKQTFAGVREVPAAMRAAMVFLAALTVFFGLFPDVVVGKWLLPAADALIDRAGYIQAVLSGGQG